MMAERRQGPVKPPTIDLSARDADRPDAAGPAAREEAEEVASLFDEDPATPETAVPPVPPTPPAPPARGPGWGGLALAGGVGALLGTALTYVLAGVVPLPDHSPQIADPAQAIADHADRLGLVEDRLATLESSALEARTAGETARTEVAAGFDEVRGLVEGLRTQIPAPTDTTAVDARLRTLSQRVDAIAAGASSADAGAIAANLANLEEDLDALGRRLDAIDNQADAVAALEAEVAALRGALEAPPEPAVAVSPPASDLGLAVARLEAAFASGRPYAAELDALAQAAPQIAVPPLVASRAAEGLPLADTLVQRFAQAVPEMLAARQAAPDAPWQDTAAGWVRSMLALRPAGETEGDTPEAVLSRLEAAVERRDFSAAAPLIAALPADMVAPAEDLAADIAVRAEAASMLAGLAANREAAP